MAHEIRAAVAEDVEQAATPFDLRRHGMIVGMGAAAMVVESAAAARERGPVHIHEPLMKRAEALADKSPFLRKVSREFKANGHISNRQADVFFLVRMAV